MSTSAATVEKRGVGRPKRQIDVSKTDELKQLGFTTAQRGNGLFAEAIDGNKEYGPAASISALLTLVKKEIGNKIELPKDNGEPPVSLPVEQRLPTMAEPEIDALNLQADRCIEAKEKKASAITTMNDAYDTMETLLATHGRTRYSRKGWTLVIEDKKRLTIKPEKKETTKKRGKKDDA